MKKFILFLGFISMMLTVSAKTNGLEVVTNSIDTVYHDGKAVIDSVYHDGKSVVTTVYEDAKTGLGSIYPDVRSAVISIGKAIGVAAEHVYTVLVKKYFVIGIKHLCVALFGLILIIIGSVMWNKTTKNKPITYRVALPLIFVIVGIITVARVDYDEMLMGLINPEYGAINYILDYTKNIFN